MIKFSFVIATLNRPKQLQGCIDSIERAYDFKKDVDIEVLIIFQDEGDYNANLLSRYPQLLKKYYIQQVGLSKARNFAISKSKGEIIIFLDDDAKIKEDFLNKLYKVTLDSKSDAFCGRILEETTKNPFGGCFLEEQNRYLNRLDFRYFMGSNHILKKEIIDKIGLYDEVFGAGSKYPAAEESDLFFRMKKRNLRIAYVPELIFYHPVTGIAAEKVYGYYQACGAMLVKQVSVDLNHGLIYIYIMLDIILKSFIRIIQSVFFPRTIRAKNKRYHYASVFLGIISGVIVYITGSKLELKRP